MPFRKFDIGIIDFKCGRLDYSVKAEDKSEMEIPKSEIKPPAA
jgi:hypothetical protein